MRLTNKLFAVALSCALVGTASAVPAFAYSGSPAQQAQQRVTVSGRVVDETGQPVIGAGIVEAGTSNGTLTDLDGNFSIKTASDAVLAVSSVGYKTIEVAVNGQEYLDIVLPEDNEKLDEIVVVGYGTQKKATLTGSISSVNGDELKKVSTTNISNTLAGKTAGVIANTRSGEPGEDDATILIRGKGTLGDTSPLIVVDGIADRSFSRLNPEDIESISVLKDASAAIYGARAANGVILVTTKRGKEGALKINYNGSYTMQQPTRVPTMLNSYQYGTYVNEYDAQERHGQSGQTYTEEALQHFLTGDDPLNYPSTNWWDECTNEWAGKTQHSVSLSGGTDRISFYTSAQYMWQNAIYKNSAFSYNQYQFVTNVDAKVTDAIKLSLDILGRQEDRQRGSNSTDDIYTYFLQTFPGTQPYYPNGLPKVGFDGVTHNAAIMMTDAAGTNNTVADILTIKPTLRIDLGKLTQGLYLEGYAAMDYDFTNTKSLSHPFDVYLYDSETGEYENRRSGTGSISVSNTSSKSVTTTLNGRIGYDRVFNGVHNVSAFVAYEQMKYQYSYLYGYRTNYLSATIPELFAGSTVPADQSNDGSSNIITRVNFFGRANYGYKDKYLAEVTFRYDGSMNFAQGKRWGFFPGVSLGWVMSEEDFWQPIKETVSFFKLKGSWGMMGNDNVDAYQYLSQYQFKSTSPYFGTQTQAMYLARTANPDITWEKAQTYNAGFVANFLHGKFSLDADYFFSKRSDILITRNASIPSYAGLTLPEENLGKVNNQGVELVASYHDKAGDWTWGVTGNFTYARNKIVYMDEAANVPEWQKQEGYPIDSQLLYQAVKIYQSDEEAQSTATIDDTVGAGDLQYVDMDGNGVITANDMYRVYLTATPRIVYGVTLNAAWKGIDFNMFWQGQALSQTLMMPTMNMPVDFYEGRYIVGSTDPENSTNARWPKALIKQTYTDSWNGVRSTWWLRNSAFCRLKNVELGYTFPSALTKKAKIDNLRIYVNGSNLFTIDSFKVTDPEVGSITSYPLQRMITFGANITF